MINQKRRYVEMKNILKDALCIFFTAAGGFLFLINYEYLKPNNYLFFFTFMCNCIVFYLAMSITIYFTDKRKYRKS